MVPSSMDLDVLDDNVYQLLESGSMQTWSHDVNMAKAKIIKKRGRSTVRQSIKDADIEDEFIVSSLTLNSLCEPFSPM